MAKRLITPEVKDGILDAFEQAGGVDYLIELARRDPQTFCLLLGKVVQAEIRAETPKQTNKFDMGKLMAEAEIRRTKLDNSQ
jgi:hypothetical protein